MSEATRAKGNLIPPELVAIDKIVKRLIVGFL